MPDNRFEVGDLVQLDDEYKRHNNPSLFRIREIDEDGLAVLGQLSSDSDRYIGVDCTIELDDPDLVEPYQEVLAMYPWLQQR